MKRRERKNRSRQHIHIHTVKRRHNILEHHRIHKYIETRTHVFTLKTMVHHSYHKRMYVLSVCTHENTNRATIENLKSLTIEQRQSIYWQWRCCTHTAKRPKCNFIHTWTGSTKKKPFWICVCVWLCVHGVSVSCRMNNARVCCLYCVFLFMWFTIAHCLSVWMYVCLNVCVFVCWIEVDVDKNFDVDQIMNTNWWISD